MELARKSATEAGRLRSPMCATAPTVMAAATTLHLGCCDSREICSNDCRGGAGYCRLRFHPTHSNVTRCDFNKL